MSFNKPSMNGLNHFSIEEVNEDIANLETTKQNILTAGTNVSIIGNEISATDTNDVYTAGSNVSIIGNEISATDTNDVYTAGSNVSIIGNEISSTDTNDVYTAGTNVSIVGNEISSTDTNDVYTAGTNISIIGNEISSTDTNDVYTAGTNISIIGNEISSTDTNDVYTGGDGIIINSNVIKAQYIVPNIRLLSFDKNNINQSSWGNGSYNDTVLNNRRTGEDFSTVDSEGIITLTKNGFYKISVSTMTQSRTYNNRIGFANYLRINLTDYFENEDYNFFGWSYTRNDFDGGHGSSAFKDYIYLETGDTIMVRHKIETGSDLLFNETLSSSSVNNYLTIQVERIFETNPEY